MSRQPSIPSYRLHKPTGQAVVTIRSPGGGRRDVYLGKYNSSKSRAEYGRLVSELAAAVAPDQVGSTKACNPVVDQILILFWRYAEQHYRRADGTLTHELVEYRQAFKPLRNLYGHTRACDFGPLSLKAVREAMVRQQLSRRLINQRIGRVKRVFKWAASEQLIPVSVHAALATVFGLQRGRTVATDHDPIQPVAVDHVLATLPYLPPEVAAMVEVQLLTGMRPGEVCQLRPMDIDRTGAVWLFRPTQYKTLHRGKARVVVIGPLAQAILAAFWPNDAASYVFSPRRAVERFHAERSVLRTTPRYPSHMRRNAEKRTQSPHRTPAERYTAESYGKAVARAVVRANRPLIEAAVEIVLHVPHWHPNQLRHAHGTAARKRFGIEAAQMALGHAHANVTEIYAEKNLALAAMVATAIG